MREFLCSWILCSVCPYKSCEEYQYSQGLFIVDYSGAQTEWKIMSVAFVRRDKSFSLSVSVNLRVPLYLVTGFRSAAILRFSEEGHANDTWRTCLIICGIMVRMPDEARLPWVMYEGRGE